MGSLFYHSSLTVCRLIMSPCIRQVVTSPEQADRPGGFILACTHLSHLEPFVVAAVVRRQIRWMARIEFYRYWWAAAVLNGCQAFPVDRFHRPLPAVRTAIRLVKAGAMVGMFPEGGVARGSQSVVRGGRVRQGACTISVETRAPVVPVVVLGAHDLNRVKPWLPFKRGRLWIAFGRDVFPPPRSESRKRDRAEMEVRLRSEYVRTYQQLLRDHELADSDIP